MDAVHGSQKRLMLDGRNAVNMFSDLEAVADYHGIAGQTKLHEKRIRGKRCQAQPPLAIGCERSERVLIEVRWIVGHPDHIKVNIRYAVAAGVADSKILGTIVSGQRCIILEVKPSGGIGM
ncbi:MAG: hypothetical protein ABIJ45_02450 [Candidatus Zixiibacteriota bacterium]